MKGIDDTYVQNKRILLTWKPFDTIFSVRAHVHISLKNTLNVFSPMRVSGRSSV